MKVLSLFVISIMMFMACKKSSNCVYIPTCITAKIDQHRFDPDWEVGSVEEYSYQGKIIYAFVPDFRIITDGSTEIYNTECVLICSVGGFGGPSINQCNGENFYQKSVLIRKIWEKP